MKLKDTSYYPGDREIKDVKYYNEPKEGIILVNGSKATILGEGVVQIDNNDIPHYIYHTEGYRKENGEPAVTPKYNLGIIKWELFDPT